jgi:hypothetical protein
LTLKELAYQLCINDYPKTTAEERQILWASNIAVLLTAEAIEKDPQFPNGGNAFLGRLSKGLLSLLSGNLPFHERAEAGRNLAALGDLESLNIQQLYSFREKGINLDINAANAVLKQLDFFVSDWHKEGKGCIHIYQPQTISGGKVVLDYASGLMWQQEGSDRGGYKKAQEYIKKLNGDKFAGYSDWRLPTLEEAMSLMEPKKKSEGLYIDQLFNLDQNWIWTADLYSTYTAWFVHFINGYCYYGGIGIGYYYVRAVRSL